MSNYLILHKEGYFLIWEEFDRGRGTGKNPYTLNLATIYKTIYACSVHPSRSCICLQVADNSMIILFLKEKAAEEIKLTFPKARYIQAFSFMLGDDFNFFVASNVAIDLYDIKIGKQKAKLVKNISISISDPQFFYEPLSNILVMADSKGLCYPFYLNLFKSKGHRGKTFQLDVGIGAQRQSEDLSQSRDSSRLSLSERAFSYFKKGSQRFSIYPNIYNKNLKYQSQEISQSQSIATDPSLDPTKINRRNSHQILLSNVYNKSLMFHLNPFNNQIEMIELNPSTFLKSPNPILVAANALHQMQIIDNLLVVHNFDDRSSSLYDLKLSDYYTPINSEQCSVDSSTLPKGVYFSDIIFQEEKEAEEQEQYKLVFRDGEIEGQQSKDYVEMNFKLHYTEDDDQMLKAEVNVPVGETNRQPIIEEDKQEEAQRTSVQVEEEKEDSINIYDESIMFIDPFIMVDLKNQSCLTFKINNKKIIKFCSDKCRGALILINRSKNKPLFIKNLKELLIKENLNMLEISRIFQRVNTIYKLASIERQSQRKKLSSKLELKRNLKEITNIDSLLVQFQRLGRIKTNQNMNAQHINMLLSECTPSSRLLTGEAIIFQNEMLEIFRDIINASAFPITEDIKKNLKQGEGLKSRYVVAIIQEFIRTLLENSIPQQPSQQAMLIKYVIKSQDYQILHSLLQYHVLSDSLELARILVALGSHENKTKNTFFYEPAYQLGLDMLQRLKVFDEIVIALVNEEQVLKALDFAQIYKVHSMKISSFLENVERLKNEGLPEKAEVVLKRITEIKKYDEVKLKADRDYKPLLIEE